MQCGDRRSAYAKLLGSRYRKNATKSPHHRNNGSRWFLSCGVFTQKDYRVFGLIRRSSTINFERIKHLQDEVELVPGDLLDQSSLITALQKTEPHEVYNLAAQSFVPTSWSQPVLTGEFTALGVTRMLEAIRVVNPALRFYQASSSEMFAWCKNRRRRSRLILSPQSLRCRQTVRSLDHGECARELRPLCVFGYFVQSRITARGIEFVSRRVTYNVARIKLGLQDKLKMGTLMLSGTGASRAIMFEPCGSCCSRKSPTIMLIATGQSTA